MQDWFLRPFFYKSKHELKRKILFEMASTLITKITYWQRFSHTVLSIIIFVIIIWYSYHSLTTRCNIGLNLIQTWKLSLLNGRYWGEFTWKNVNLTAVTTIKSMTQRCHLDLLVQVRTAWWKGRRGHSEKNSLWSFIWSRHNQTVSLRSYTNRHLHLLQW